MQFFSKKFIDSWGISDAIPCRLYNLLVRLVDRSIFTASIILVDIVYQKHENTHFSFYKNVFCAFFPTWIATMPKVFR